MTSLLRAGEALQRPSAGLSSPTGSSNAAEVEVRSTLSLARMSSRRDQPSTRARASSVSVVVPGIKQRLPRLLALPEASDSTQTTIKDAFDAKVY